MTLPPSIPVGDLMLRRYRLDHGLHIAEAVVESGRHLSRYETWAHASFDEEEGRRHAAWWEQAWEVGSARYFGIWRGDRYLGSAGLSEINLGHRIAGLGYWVRTSETGHGVATSAATAIIAAGFEHLGLQRIEIMAAVDNLASRRVAEKAGAILEGTLRKRQVLDGVPVDCALYSVVD